MDHTELVVYEVSRLVLLVGQQIVSVNPSVHSLVSRILGI